MTDTGDPERPEDDDGAEARRLRQRLERGELPYDRLTLADYLDHRPSRLALGRGTPAPAPGLMDDASADADPDATLEYWGRRLARWGPQVMLRAAVALGRGVTQGTDPPPEAARSLAGAFAAADRFLAALEEDAVAAQEGLQEAAQASAEVTARAALTLDADAPARRACTTTLPALRMILEVLEGGVPDRAQLDGHYLSVLEHAEASELPLERLQAAVRDEVLPWALRDRSA